jgi:hypothetical protein
VFHACGEAIASVRNKLNKGTQAPRPASDVADEDLIRAAEATGPTLERNATPKARIRRVYSLGSLDRWRIELPLQSAGPKTIRAGWNKLDATALGYAIERHGKMRQSGRARRGFTRHVSFAYPILGAGAVPCVRARPVRQALTDWPDLHSRAGAQLGTKLRSERLLLQLANAR